MRFDPSGHSDVGIESALRNKAFMRNMGDLDQVEERLVISVLITSGIYGGAMVFAKYDISKMAAEAISNGKIKHVLTDHTYDKMSITINKMMEKGLSESAEKLLNKKSFFNPSWSEQKVIDATNQAYNKVLSQGFANGEHAVKVFGKKVTVYLENGVFRSAYGDFKLTLSDFGF